MILLEQVSADLVVACWLKAELSSRRFRPRVVKALQHFSLPLRAIERPRLASPRENQLRAQALHRYRQDTWGVLPEDTQWWRAAITPLEFRRLRVINYPTWSFLSRNTGRLSTAAAVIARETVPATAKSRWAREARAVITHVGRVKQRIQAADLQTKLIVMGRHGGTIWTILEGNKRAAALYIHCFLEKVEPFPSSIHILLGLTSQPSSALRID